MHVHLIGFRNKNNLYASLDRMIYLYEHIVVYFIPAKADLGKKWDLRILDPEEHFKSHHIGELLDQFQQTLDNVQWTLKQQCFILDCK